MPAPSSKMLDMLTAAFTSVPCGGSCIMYNEALNEDEPNMFTTLSIQSKQRILQFIPDIETANMMVQVTNAVERIRQQVYHK